jgi:hypothetical protein
MDWLNQYKQTLKTAWGYNDYNDWPVKFNSIMHLFIEPFAREFIEDLYIAREKMTIAEVALLFCNPSRIYRIIHSVLLGMKKGLCSLQQQRDIAQTMLEMVDAIKEGSPFNEDGRNIVLSQSAIAQLNPMDLSDPEKSRCLHQVFGVLWAYTESIFFRAHDVTKEIHGAYEFNGNKLIIREYLNLNARAVWPDMPLLPHDTIKVYTTYRPSIDVSIDSYNHLYLNHGNFVEDLTDYRIEIDGTKVDVPVLYALVKRMLDGIQLIHQWAKEASWQEKTEKYAEIYWYRKAPLRHIRKIDWHVPEEVRIAIREGAVDERREARLTNRQIDFLITTLL